MEEIEFNVTNMKEILIVDRKNKDRLNAKKFSKEKTVVIKIHTSRSQLFVATAFIKIAIIKLLL